jgi:signal transduction histidine kinase
LLAVVGALGAWCLVFLATALGRGLTHRLVIADSLTVCAAVLLQGHLVSAAEIPNSSAWLMPVATAAVLLAQLRLHPTVGVPLGLLVAVSYVVGQTLAQPLHPVMLIGAGILILQTVLAAATMQLLRRAGRSAEAECDRRAQQDREAQFAAARRADEREHFRNLHDTALATLTMVGSGSVRPASTTLRSRAAYDASALRIRSGRDQATSEGEQLDTRLQAVVDREAAGLDVAVSVTPVLVRDDVLTAMAACVGEALRNVARHSGVKTASVDASVDGSGLVRVDIRDRGRGFDLHSIDAHRRGVRESIVRRMADVGGEAEVRSSPAQGTQIVLRWRDDDRDN